MKKLILSMILCSLLLASCGSEPKSQVLETREESTEAIFSEAPVDYERFGLVDQGESIGVTDAEGKEISLPKSPKRVVIGFNSYVQLWYQLGGTLVGKIKESPDLPVPGAEDVQVIGDTKALSEEVILSLKPDLVILSVSNDQLQTAENLRQAGIQVLTIQVRNFEEYLRSARIFSAIMGNELAYETHGVQVEAKVKEILSKVPVDKSLKAILLNNSSKAIKISTSENTTGEMLKDLGVDNVADAFGSESDSVDFSLEQILVEDPDFIFLRPMGSDGKKAEEIRKKLLDEDPVWSSLRAVKDGHYIILDKDLYTYKPNVRYAEAYLNLAKMLYPDAY